MHKYISGVQNNLVSDKKGQQQADKIKMMTTKILLITLLCSSLVSLLSFKTFNYRSLSKVYERERYGSKYILHAKIAKKEEDTTKQTEGGEDESTVKVPFNGLMGFEQGSC